MNPDHGLRVGGPQEALGLLLVSKRAAHLAQAGAHSHGHRPPAWRASGTGDEIPTPAEWSVSKLQLRFQQSAAQLLEPAGPILDFIPRPYSESPGRLPFRLRLRHNEGLLAITKGQTPWIEEVVRPVPGVVGYGYPAWSIPLERPVGFGVSDGAGGSRLKVTARAHRLSCSMTTKSPAASAAPLRGVSRIAHSFLPGRCPAGSLMRLEHPPADETPLSAPIRHDDAAAPTAIDTWQECLEEALLPCKTVLAKAIIPSSAAQSRTPSLWVVTDRRVLQLSGPSSATRLPAARYLANLCGVTVCRSVFRSWLRCAWDAAGERISTTIRFPLVVAGTFVKVFVALRQAVVSAYGFASIEASDGEPPAGRSE